MRIGRLTALALACALAGTLAGRAPAMGTTTHQRKKHAPKFDKRYDCARVAPVKLVNSFLGTWEGNVALKGKSAHQVYKGGGGSACTYKHAGGPFAGSLLVEYGAKAASAYEADERPAKHNGAEACAQHGNPSGDPRVCGPVELSGVGSHAYEAFFYIAALKRKKFFVQLLAGPGVANGQWVPSSTLPPADALENAEKAILAKLH